MEKTLVWDLCILAVPETFLKSFHVFNLRWRAWNVRTLNFVLLKGFSWKRKRVFKFIRNWNTSISGKNQSFLWAEIFVEKLTLVSIPNSLGIFRTNFFEIRKLSFKKRICQHFLHFCSRFVYPVVFPFIAFGFCQSIMEKFTKFVCCRRTNAVSMSTSTHDLQNQMSGKRLLRKDSGSDHDNNVMTLVATQDGQLVHFLYIVYSQVRL